MSSLRSFLRKAEDFFLKPASPRPLAAIRIALALILLAQAYLLRNSALDFFANDGMVQGELARHFADADVPRVSWLYPVTSFLHLGEAATIQAFCGLYVAGIVLLGLGLFTRAATVLVWLLHWTLMNTGQTTAYGVDIYAHVILFYLIWMPAGAVLSVDAWRRGAAAGAPSTPARLGLRVLQLHLCITYLCSAIDKGQGSQWWDGELLWRVLTLPQYRQFDFTWMASWPLIPKIAGLGALAMEAGYCLFIWPRKTRKLWVAAMVSLHLGIVVFLGLGLFGLLMASLTPCLFAISAEPEAEVDPLKRSILLFDGACNLCDSFVLFVIRRDPRHRFAMTSLQSEKGRELRERHGVPGDGLSSLVLIEDGRAYTRSTAVLILMRGLSGLWPALSIFLFVPRFARDRIYDQVAARRYRWFGRKTSCELMTPELQRRFL